MNTIGIDACRYGWCAIGSVQGKLISGCFASLKEVLLQHQNIHRILIDIPIGLSSKTFIRTVDAKARTLLDNRKSSIFSPPCREALQTENYNKALVINREIEGKGISIQAYNISEKIKEVDEYLDQPAVEVEIFEAHPELCFKSLNAGQDLPYSKHEKQGIDLRKQIVFRHQKALESVYDNLLNDYKRHQVKADDILDAMALYLINQNSEILKVVTDENRIDETGKSVGIVYG